MFLLFIWLNHHEKQTNVIFIFLFFYFKVGVQFQIMTFLSPSDICRLGATSQYWRAMVRDSLLWRYFLLRDTPGWSSIDHVTMPNLDMLDAPLISVEESLDDREEGDEREREIKFDYMSEWVLLRWISEGLPQRLECIFLFRQIPERMPLLQTEVAPFAASLRCHDLLSPVHRASIGTSLRHVWSWHGAAGCVAGHQAHARPWCAARSNHSLPSDKWYSLTEPLGSPDLPESVWSSWNFLFQAQITCRYTLC